MARSRNIKPKFFTNEELAECSPLARLLFAGLWTVADREGRLEDRPKRIKAELLPYDQCDVDQLLTELAAGGFIARYLAESSRCIQVLNFSRHQHPHVKEPQSQIPPWNGVAESLVQVPGKTGSFPALTLNPHTDSLVADSLKGAAVPPTDEPSPAEKPAKVKPEEIAIPGELDTPEFRAARDAWFKQRRTKRISLRPEYVTGQYARLLPLGPANAAACLMDTVANDYDGVFPAKFINGPNAKPTQPKRTGSGQRFQGT